MSGKIFFCSFQHEHVRGVYSKDSQCVTATPIDRWISKNSVNYPTETRSDDANDRDNPFNREIRCWRASPGRTWRLRVPSPWYPVTSTCQDHRSPLPWIPSANVRDRRASDGEQRQNPRSFEILYINRFFHFFTYFIDWFINHRSKHYIPERAMATVLTPPRGVSASLALEPKSFSR